MVALVLDVVIAVTGILIGPRFNLTGALAIGPLLACARCDGRLTGLTAGVAAGLCAVVGTVTGTIGTSGQRDTASPWCSWSGPSPCSPP